MAARVQQNDQDMLGVSRVLNLPAPASAGEPWRMGDLSAARTAIYSSGATPSQVGNNSTARASLLPASALDGKTYFKVPANALPSGGVAMVQGQGTVSASTVSAGTDFTLYPWFTTTEGGTKTDCGATTISLTLGVSGICIFTGLLQQIGTQLLITGTVEYGTQNGQGFTWEVNPSGTLVTSDPTVDRWFGFDAAYSTANAANVQKTYAVAAFLSTPFQTTQVPASLGIDVDGGGSVITAGFKGYRRVPANCTIQASTILLDQSGSVTFDVRRVTYAQFAPGTRPTTTDTIVASAPPTVSGAAKSKDTTLTGWTKTLSQDDILAFYVTGTPATATRAVLDLAVLKQ